LADFAIERKINMISLQNNVRGDRYTGNASAEMTVCVTDEEIRREQKFFPAVTWAAVTLQKTAPFR
jgi:hypothetical protein